MTNWSHNLLILCQISFATEMFIFEPVYLMESSRALITNLLKIHNDCVANELFQDLLLNWIADLRWQLMATSSLNARKLRPDRKELRGRNDFIFSVNRGPVTPQKRDKSHFEDHRQRAFVESMQNSFRTISFRSEPTVGEENLTRRSTSRKAGEMISQTQAPGKTNLTLMNKKSEELVQNFCTWMLRAYIKFSSLPKRHSKAEFWFQSSVPLW